MFTVSVETHFQASHQLALSPAARIGDPAPPEARGPSRSREDEHSRLAGKGQRCLSRLGRAKTGLPVAQNPSCAEVEPEHYHNWSVIADVSSNNLNSRGIVMDFHKLKAAVDNIVAELDNTVLHKTDYFRQNSPSAENVAKYIYEKLEPKLPKGVKLQSIRVVEGPAHRRPIRSRPRVAACSAKFAPDKVR